jgi:hypothetical protein
MSSRDLLVRPAPAIALASGILPGNAGRGVATGARIALWMTGRG